MRQTPGPRLHTHEPAPVHRLPASSRPVNFSWALVMYTSRIGLPTSFAHGPFAGLTVRAELEELQQADLGRKYAVKDRRPLDPPPILKLYLYEVRHCDTARETEHELEYTHQSSGHICHVDLFPVPTDARPRGAGLKPKPEPVRRRSTSPAEAVDISPSSLTSLRISHPYSALPRGPEPSTPSRATEPPRSESPTPPVPSRSQPTARSSSSHGSSAEPTDPGVLAHFDGFPITESSMCTKALAGTTVAQASSLEHQGRKAIMFVFSDLAVKIEGSFILRYRFFDIYSPTAHPPGLVPILAECYGGRFRVFSTKEFPGLPASTALTKHVSVWGVRTNLRETERRRKRVPDASEVPSVPSASTAGSALQQAPHGRRRKIKQESDDSEGYSTD
ncbi:hypothetical protein PUNSTDRAFT_140817 [Punctularia strigosozonata HHB-11173 SS5]|uniref:uncharacterized protein n=1 Tax=Punctularia strigosozonata (strain HHB-11173) TaxID=741275 RepID=UPI000441863A|nr:uncharacterized protein PUNSTDRAFT_140817 [Punctularia strigosozonata HHB-11173 SS5]EIN14552.1 hypothetical protein PUNSTDRAFT_140817 [Punctularia strigosozonata HHB-11173 SS5]